MINEGKCDFGCGTKWKYQIGKSKRKCCSSHQNKCPSIKQKILNTKKFGKNAEANKLAAYAASQKRIKLKPGEIRYELQLVSFIRENNKIVKLNCMCLACGSNKIIRRQKFGITKSCGCVTKNKRGERSIRFKGYKGFSGTKWRSYVWNAEKRKIPFSLKIEETWDKLVKQRFTCALTGQPIELKSRGGSASLDRINNTQGYQIDNVHWVHKKINQIKMDMDVQEFKNLCKLVYLFDEGKNAINK